MIRFANAIRTDGCVFFYNPSTKKIVKSFNLPDWFITAYCTIAEKIDPTE
jgi:hypothetical protein